ncbi:LysE family translocator [Roseibium sp.]|uniref:LysE family translocator n=1 Tax=Roseibium sp. TaxID=1936156 RepID=UPI003A976973
MDVINFPLILGTAAIATATPGPSTMAIAGTSMASGRKYGMALASGVICGSLTWSTSAALGLGAIMLANAWILETIRYFGAAYLLYLAFVSAKTAIAGTERQISPVRISSVGSAFRKGYAMHLTNPKAILFFGSLYSIGVPANSTFVDLVPVIAMVGVMSLTVFMSYGWFFAIGPIRTGYARLSRWFNALFAIVFGAVGVRLLTARLT